MQKIYTIDELATILKVHVNTIKNYIKQGKIKPIKHMTVIRFTQSEVEKFIEGE